MSTCVEPGKAALQLLHFQLATLQIFLVNGCNLEFATGTGFDVLCNLNNAVGIEIQTYDSIVALRLLGLLLNAQAIALGINLGHSITFGVVHIIAKYRSLAMLFGIDNALAQQFGETYTMEDVVAQYQTGTVVADELLANDECLG